ncbi:hypothetical protein V6N12_034586 [Hibiscus sabdariffa]|uniref:Uncharacterized protein n=1 Tax=Hibiscus sabdariffa TaxID=183260 RepID=A0ABR2DHL0_9ROSI
MTRQIQPLNLLSLSCGKNICVGRGGAPKIIEVMLYWPYSIRCFFWKTTGNPQFGGINSKQGVSRKAKGNVESGLSTSSKGQGKAKEKDHKGAPKVIGDRPLQSGEERDPFSLPSIYMARFTNIIESQGSILLLAQSLDLSIVQALKAPSGHGHNYYIRQGLEAYYQRLSTRIGLGLVSSDPPILSRPP